MISRPTRRGFLRLAGVGSVGIAGCLGGGQTDSGGMAGDQPTDGTDENDAETGDNDVWYTTELADVRTGATFTVESLTDRPVLVETFAVWCSNCLSQQKELIDFHEASASARRCSRSRSSRSGTADR